MKLLRNPKLFSRFLFRERLLLSWFGLILLLGAVAAVWALYGTLAFMLPGSAEKGGQYGDMFGGITALFSGLAFAGLIFTLFVQKKELQYQREELSRLVEEQKQTKGHLKDQATHLEMQSKYIEKQIFENSFFQLLSTFNDYISGTRVSYAKRTYLGHDAYEHLLYELGSSVVSFYDKVPEGSVDFEARYREFYKTHKDDLGHILGNYTIYSNLLRIRKRQIRNSIQTSCELKSAVVNSH